MTILIAGANGYIGKYLVNALGQDTDLVAVSRSPALGHNPQGVTTVAHDLAEPWNFDVSPDVILHLATQHYLSEKTPTVESFLNNNIRALNNALDFAIRSQAKRFVYFSSITALGEVSDAIVREDTPISNPDFYGATKFLGERMVREFSKNFPTIVLRIPGVIGPDLPQGRPWINKVVTDMASGKDISFFNGEADFNNICDVQTITEFLQVYLERPDVDPFDIVNLASSNPMKMKQVIDFLHREIGSSSEVAEQKSDRKSFTIDVSHVKAKYGFSPIGTKEMLSRFLNNI